jgi:Mrp family chromosome partitioning ATPase
VLRREVPLADALAVDPRLPLKLLPGSKRLSQPMRLLGPDGVGTLLAALRPSFDLILLDSAPLVAVADAKLLAKLADAVLLVVRYGSTRRDFCDLALRGLRESGAAVAGVVLTQVDLRRHSRSGAGDAGFAYAKLGEYYAD